MRFFVYGQFFLTKAIFRGSFILYFLNYDYEVED